MHLRLCMLAAAGCLGTVSLISEPSPAAVTTEIENAVKRAERTICRSLKLSGCRKAAKKPKKSSTKSSAQKRATKPKPKPVAKKQMAQEKPSDTDKSPPNQDPPPIPQMKPVETIGNDKTIVAAPLPRQKPPATQAVTQNVEQPQTPKAPAEPEVKPPPTASTSAPPDSAAQAACQSKLASLGARFEAVNGTVGSGLCTVAVPVKLSSLNLEQSSIEFPDSPTLNCAFAVRFIEWLKESGAPIAQSQAKSSIVRMGTGPGYECRGRNGDASAKVSEHGFGNAVDITNFRLQDGRVFEVKDAVNPQSPAYATLKGLRGSACGYFTTVLGPGSNAAHDTHFHLDLGKHGSSNNYKICE